MRHIIAMRQILTPLFLIIGISATVNAQTGSIKGSVKTQDGLPGEAVNITLKDNRKGTIVDKKGNYQIKNNQSK